MKWCRPEGEGFRTGSRRWKHLRHGFCLLGNAPVLTNCRLLPAARFAVVEMTSEQILDGRGATRELARLAGEDPPLPHALLNLGLGSSHRALRHLVAATQDWQRYPTSR